MDSSTGCVRAARPAGGYHRRARLAASLCQEQGAGGIETEQTARQQAAGGVRRFRGGPESLRFQAQSHKEAEADRQAPKCRKARSTGRWGQE